MRFTLFALSVGLIAASAHSATTFKSATRGVSGTGLASSAPGTAFSLDFRSSIPEGAPYDLRQMAMIFDGFSTQFSELRIQLDSSPTIFTFYPWPGNNRQVAYTLYDLEVQPVIGDPWPATPAYIPFPREWHDEAVDGIFSGHLWVTNPSNTPNQYIFATGGAGAVFSVTPSPEPSGFLAIATLGLTFLRRRQRMA